MSPSKRGAGMFVRLFSGALLSQALTSAASLLVGLILIRHESAAQYGYYVLVTTTMLLLSGAQFAYLGPSLVNRLTNSDLSGRRDIVGGMLREQRRLLPLPAIAAAILTTILWWSGAIENSIAALMGAAILAALATLQREFFRMVLMAYRRPLDVLKADSVYVALLVGGVSLASLAPLPAATAVLALALATLVGGTLLGRAVWRHEGWNIDGAQGILREIAPVGAWAVSGGAAHWAFSQGYTFVVATTLSVTAVAAIASTRLLLIPINLLSQGISQIMLPTVSQWLRNHGAPRVLERLALFCGGVGALAVLYCAVMWMMRDWIFTHLMHRQIEHSDALLLLWSAIFVLMAIRDQMAHLLVARTKLRELSTITLASATLSLALTYAATLHYGVEGALVGVLAGELFNVLGIIVMSALESRRAVTPLRQPVPAT
jgi:O-antigen/teichoic acid export membrane protein